jgi:hypothetical protein
LLSKAISECETFKSVAGDMAYTGGSGPILTADLLAGYLFSKGENGNTTEAVQWLLRMLETREATGLFKVAVWGLSIDEELTLEDSSQIVSFTALPTSYMKDRILERAKGCYDSSVWLAHNYFDKPGVAFVTKIPNFPYISSDGAPFVKVAELQKKAREFWVFVQAAAVGHPLAIACWFEYEDQSIDFNQWQNSIAWILPEIHPRVAKSTAVSAKAIQASLQSFSALPAEVRKRLLRSMERFELSQCRYAIVDRILELTLAFEIAVSGPSRTEGAISWKVSVRSAQLVGGALAKRKSTRDAVNSLYRLRSRATHGGDLSKSDQAELEEILSLCRSIYSELISSFLTLNKEPEWESLELEARST